MEHRTDNECNVKRISDHHQELLLLDLSVVSHRTRNGARDESEEIITQSTFLKNHDFLAVSYLLTFIK